MALTFDNKVFYHIPKTGGNYVRKILKEINVTSREIGHPHSTPFDDDLSGFESFTIVRNPLGWYESYYRYRMKKGWKKDHFIDQHCMAKSFEEYIEKMLQAYPCGYVSSRYFGTVPFVDHVLRTESLTQDLRNLFRKWKYPFPNHIEPTNVTSKKIDTSISESLKIKLFNAERRILNYLKEGRYGKR